MYSYERNAYDYDRRPKVASAEETLVAMGTVLQKANDQLTHLVATTPPDDRYLAYRVAAILKSVFDVLLRVGASTAFLAVLRDREMSPADRKIIEAAAKRFGQRRIVVKKEKALEVYPKLMREFDTAVETARRVLRTNEKHTEEGSTTALQVGSFTLVNTGGFPDKVMAECAKVVERSEKLLRQKGLGKVCYGPVNVTNTIYKSTRVLAFYMVNDDTLYIRANLKGKAGPAVESVVHELGHRLQFKFLKSKKRDIDALYRRLGDQQTSNTNDLLMDKSRWPKEGDTFEHKGETFFFDRINVSGRTQLEALFKVPGERFSLRVPLTTYISSRDPSALKAVKTYVTNYAATDPDENFAEMVAFYCEDKLPSEQVEMLEAIIR